MQKNQITQFSQLPEGNSHLLLEVNDCTFNLDDKLELYFALYSKAKDAFVSENVLVRIPAGKKQVEGKIKALYAVSNV